MSDDDGGVEHPAVTCMFDQCVFLYAPHRCRTLGECGCAHVLEKAGDGGYDVINRDNPVACALLDAGLVRRAEEYNHKLRDGTTRVSTLVRT